MFHLRYRFAEIYYRRGESSHKGRSSTTARVETTVLFLPDVWNVCPAKLEWDGLHLNYKHQLEKKLSCSTGATPQLDEQEGEEEENKALIRPFSSLRFYSLLADHPPVFPPSPLLQSQLLAYLAGSDRVVVCRGLNLVASIWLLERQEERGSNIRHEVQPQQYLTHLTVNTRCLHCSLNHASDVDLKFHCWFVRGRPRLG